MPGLAIPGSAIVGLAMPGFAMPGFRAVTTLGFAMPGFAIPGLAMPGFAIPGLAIPGFAIPGFAIPGLAMPGLWVSAVRMAGLAKPKLSGSRICGALGSGLKTTNPVRPPGTGVPFGAVISCALTVTLAVGLADWINTARAMLDCAPMVTSSEVCKLNCSSEAWPCGSSCPFARAGWLPMVMRKLRCAMVVFCNVTVKARCRSCAGLAGEKPSGLKFPLEPTTNPGATVDV